LKRSWQETPTFAMMLMYLANSTSFGKPALPDKYRKKKATKERLNDNWAEAKEVIRRGIENIESREG
jgi:hypothetical protein